MADGLDFLEARSHHESLSEWGQTDGTVVSTSYADGLEEVSVADADGDDAEDAFLDVEAAEWACKVRKLLLLL